MGVISWLVDRYGLVEREKIEKVHAERDKAYFEIAELRKDRIRLQEELTRTNLRNSELESQLNDTSRHLSEMEYTAAQEDERANLAVARVADLQSQVDYLKEQVRVYQVRIGLLPQERQSQTVATPKPLRRAREPFAVVESRVQAQRTKEYWEARAAAVDAGTTGTTTEATPTVSE